MAEEGHLENHEPARPRVTLEGTRTIFVTISLAQVSHMAKTKGEVQKSWRALVVSTTGSTQPRRQLGREWVRVLSTARQGSNGG